MNPEISQTRPLVLLFGGLDPSGAGLQADIETCFALGCHPLPIATALTVQNTRSLSAVKPTSARVIVSQARHLLSDITQIGACKIGMLPTAASVRAVAEIVRPLAEAIPVILDPVRVTSSGGKLVGCNTIAALQDFLLPLVILVKPNRGEARDLTGQQDFRLAGADLSQRTRGGALLTGTDETPGSLICHSLYRAGKLHAEYYYPKISGQFHGTGCTVTSAIAAYMAHGATLDCAVAAGMCYTWKAVRRGYSIGGEQMIPGRLLNRDQR